jgi:hypothetical protein
MDTKTTRRNFVIGIAADLLAATPIGGAMAEEPMRWRGDYADTAEPYSAVAETKSAWRRLWRLAGKTPPPFDERRQTGIGVFLGRRNTGGYHATIVSMGDRDGRFVVVVDEERPAAGSFVTQALTSPWLILLIDRPALPVEIEPRFHTQN